LTPKSENTPVPVRGGEVDGEAKVAQFYIPTRIGFHSAQTGQQSQPARSIQRPLEVNKHQLLQVRQLRNGRQVGLHRFLFYMTQLKIGDVFSDARLNHMFQNPPINIIKQSNRQLSRENVGDKIDNFQLLVCPRMYIEFNFDLAQMLYFLSISISSLGSASGSFVNSSTCRCSGSNNCSQNKRSHLSDVTRSFSTRLRSPRWDTAVEEISTLVRLGMSPKNNVANGATRPISRPMRVTLVIFLTNSVLMKSRCKLSFVIGIFSMDFRFGQFLWIVCAQLTSDCLAEKCVTSK